MSFFKKIKKGLKKAIGIGSSLSLTSRLAGDYSIGASIAGTTPSQIRARNALAAFKNSPYATIPGFVPEGFDKEDFYAKDLGGTKDADLQKRRTALNKYTNQLKDSIASGDIMTYNSTLAKFRKEAGLDVAEMPDKIRRKPRKPGSREKNTQFPGGLGLVGTPSNTRRFRG